MATKKTSSTVPGQYLGFELQGIRAAQLLMEAPKGSFIGVEHLDDTSMLSPLDTTLLSQTKSVTSRGNPISDRSVDFWKTLANWIRVIEDTKIDPSKTKFEMYITKNVKGSLAAQFNEARTLSDASKALDLATEELWGPAPHFPKKKDVRDGLAEQVECVFNCKRDVLLHVIMGFQLTFSEHSPIVDLESAVSDKLVPSEHVESVVYHLLGWVKSEVDKLLAKRQTALLSRDECHKEMNLFVQKLRIENPLSSFSDEPLEDEIQNFLKAKFVKQLRLVGLDDLCHTAISDYYRTTTDSIKWAEDGAVHEHSFDELDERLKRVWRNNKGKITNSHEDKADEQKGALLFYECESHEDKLEGHMPPVHFIPGCFHKLADLLTIGWHPDYKSLLKTEDVI